MDQRINLFFLDHEQQTYQNVLDQKLNPAVFEKRVDYLIENRDINQEKNLSVNEWIFGPAKNWRGLPVKEQINNMNTIKYSAKGSFTLSTCDKEIIIDGEREKSLTRGGFDYYFCKTLNSCTWKGYKQSENSLQLLIEFLSKLENERKEKKSRTSKKTTREFFFSKDQHHLSSEEFNDPTISASGGKKNEGKVSTTKKSMQSEVWLANDVPLKIQDLIPILDVIATNTEDILQVKNFLQSNFLQEIALFPVKCVFPLLLSFYCTVEISDISFK